MASLDHCADQCKKLISQDGLPMDFRQRKYTRDRSEKKAKRFWKCLVNICLYAGLYVLRREVLSLSKEQQWHFDQLATLYNHANGSKLKYRCKVLKRRGDQENFCLAAYFRANFLLLRCEFKQAEYLLSEALERSVSTSKPNLFKKLLSSPMARLLCMENLLSRLETFLRECFQCTETSGSFDGWIYYMQGMLHYKRSQRLKEVKDIMESENEIALAIENMKYALDRFNTSPTEDKYFGMAHASARLVIFYLRCGENSPLNEHYEVQPSDKMNADKYLKEIRKSQKFLHDNVVIRILYNMAESNYNFRNSKLDKATFYANDAFKLAEEHECYEYIDNTRLWKELLPRRDSKGNVLNIRKRKLSTTVSESTSATKGTSETTGTSGLSTSVYADMETHSDISLAMDQVRDSAIFPDDFLDRKRRKMDQEKAEKVNSTGDSKTSTSNSSHPMETNDPTININIHSAKRVHTAPFPKRLKLSIS